MHRYDSIGFDPDCGCHKKHSHKFHCPDALEETLEWLKKEEYKHPGPKEPRHSGCPHKSPFFSFEEFACHFIKKINEFMSKGFVTLKQALDIFVTRKEYADAVTTVAASGTKPLNLKAEKESGHKVLITGDIDVVTETSSGIMSSQDKVNLDYLITNVNIRLEHVQDVDDIVTHEEL